MAKKSKRIDVNTEPEPLSHNPFAELSGADVPAPEPESTQEEPGQESAFRIGRTRKGGFALSVERRPGGKVVTVLDNVEGDAEALLRLLRKRCGAGGAVREGAIEIQGDHRERIEALLNSGIE